MPCQNCDPAYNKAGRIIKTNKELNRCAICSEKLIGRIGLFKSMKHILILGIDGYIGWELALNLLKQGYSVSGLDNFSRRERASDSLTPIDFKQDRLHTLSQYSNFKHYHLHSLAIFEKMSKEKPDTIIHLAEQPSASWSMESYNQAAITQQENVLGTLRLLWLMKLHCPDAHLIKLGTMGEYGKPNCDIPEGEIPNQPCYHIKDDSIHDLKPMKPGKIIRLKKKCPMAGLPFPRTPNSFYHLSKVHDSYNISFACRTWGLTSTDIMQGVLYGLINTERKLITRFDYDEHFGTVINRFCAQAIIEHPLTVYGSGNQSYSFLPLKDSIQCINLLINSIPSKGEYRTVNQFGEIYNVNTLANLVCRVAKTLNLNSSITHIPNPRSEPEDHYYNPSNSTLLSLGYKPTTNLEEEITNIITTILPYKDRIDPDLIMPKTTWR